MSAIIEGVVVFVVASGASFLVGLIIGAERESKQWANYGTDRGRRGT